MSNLFNSSNVFETLSNSLIELKIDYTQIAKTAQNYLDYLGDAYVDGSLDSTDLRQLTDVASNITLFQQEMIGKNKEILSILKNLKDTLETTYN